MKEKKGNDFIIRVPKKLYTMDLQRMFDYLRFCKATVPSKASQKAIDDLVSAVQKARNERKHAICYL